MATANTSVKKKKEKKPKGNYELFYNILDKNATKAMATPQAVALIKAAWAQGITLKHTKGETSERAATLCMASNKKPPGLTPDLFRLLNCTIKLYVTLS